MPQPLFVQPPARNGLNNACERILRAFRLRAGSSGDWAGYRAGKCALPSVQGVAHSKCEAGFKTQQSLGGHPRLQLPGPVLLGV